MISQKLQEAFNAQIQAEFYSAYLYLGMSADAERQNYKGAAAWLRTQHGEELAHGYKLVQYLYDRGGRVQLKALDAPPAEFGPPARIFEAVLKHEQHVTALIHKLYETAAAEKDLAAQVFLQWYVTEQVEEEASATVILERLRMAGDKPSTVLYLDKELGKRAKGE
ncbi:MAG: ferritin [Deltaproteobacteria bacterium]|nr:ferritin [Deltaproteobacteria bacterium]